MRVGLCVRKDITNWENESEIRNGGGNTYPLQILPKRKNSIGWPSTNDGLTLAKDVVGWYLYNYAF